MNEKRPDPDELLRKMNIAEAEKGKGKLKIFFGYAAGVGKTYAMLDAAHTVKKSGIDVVVGYVEPHMRPETSTLLEGLEIITPLSINYKGIILNELNLDAALERKPQLILVDELAHTNAEGSRHTKRYNDIEELLNAGIDVFTTVNVQHLESLNDIVASITQIIVKERIPDSVFDEASQVELVDIEPIDLIERLNKEKIYQGLQVQKALDHFFIEENLIALREIALRRTADRVNKAVENNKLLCKNNEYYTSEQILVCLSSSPSNPKVIRTAARMANAFHVAFTALFVATPETERLDKISQERLQNNIKLVEQLGGKIATVYGEDVAYQIAEYAKVSGVSKIVMGRANNRPRPFYKKATFVEKLTASAPNLDIYIIPDSLPPSKQKRKPKLSGFKPNGKDSLKAASILLICTLIGIYFYEIGMNESNIIMIYILGVLLISNQTSSKIYGLTSSVIGVLVFNFCFTHPRFSFEVNGAQYPITFTVMFMVAFITSTLTIRVRNQAEVAVRKAYRTEVLLETSQKLQRTETMQDIIRAASEQLVKLLDQTIIIYAAKEEELLQPQVFITKEEVVYKSEYIAADEQAVANWVFKNKKVAGMTTDTLPGSKVLYLPILSHEEALGVVGIILKENKEIETFEKSLLLAMLSEISFAIEKYNLNERQKKVSMQAERERLRANLLRAISHDLRTPLTSISGNANILLTNEAQMEVGIKHKIYEDIYDDALWLINLVENLLSVTRIDDEKVNIKRQPELIEEIIAEALRHVNRKKTEHNIKVIVKDELLMANVDPRLIIQVIINIVDNAIKYTPVGSHIHMTAFRQHNKVVIETSDDGQGISKQDKEQLFDMFFTADHNKGDNRRGLGLGLSLCQSIVNAHGGEIYVRDNKPRGTVFGFTLELEEVVGDE